MNPDEPGTLGARLDRHARAVLARRAEPALRRATRGHPRSFDPPGASRLRVEADVPPAWTEEWDGTPAVHGPPTGQPFPAELRDRLTPLVGPGLDGAVVHDGDLDPAADAVARAHDAAAVTVGRQIFLRQGRFRPRSPAGRALLAHEAVHAVLAVRPGAGWRRATNGGRAAEERLAHDLGTTFATGTAGPLAPAGVRGGHPAGRPVRADRLPVPRAPGRPGGLEPHGPVRPAGPATPAGPAGRAGSATSIPMAAPLGSPEPAAPAAGPAPGPDSPPDAVLRELLRQVRIDRERGA